MTHTPETIEAVAAILELDGWIDCNEARGIAITVLSAIPRNEWRSMEEAPKGDGEDTGPEIILWNGERKGGGVWDPNGGEYIDDDSGFSKTGAWRWANDSCECCWTDMNPLPIGWQPLPDAPE